MTLEGPIMKSLPMVRLLHFSVKEKICYFFYRLHNLKGCEGVRTEEQQAFTPLPSMNPMYY